MARRCSGCGRERSCSQGAYTERVAPIATAARSRVWCLDSRPRAEERAARVHRSSPTPENPTTRGKRILPGAEERSYQPAQAGGPEERPPPPSYCGSVNVVRWAQSCAGGL